MRLTQNRIIAALLLIGILAVSGTAFAFPPRGPGRHGPGPHYMEGPMPPRHPHRPHPGMRPPMPPQPQLYYNSYDSETSASFGAGDTFKSAFANAAGETIGTAVGSAAGEIIGSIFAPLSNR